MAHEKNHRITEEDMGRQVGVTRSGSPLTIQRPPAGQSSGGWVVRPEQEIPSVVNGANGLPRVEDDPNPITIEMLDQHEAKFPSEEPEIPTTTEDYEKELAEIKKEATQESAAAAGKLGDQSEIMRMDRTEGNTPEEANVELALRGVTEGDPKAMEYLKITAYNGMPYAEIMNRDGQEIAIPLNPKQLLGIVSAREKSRLDIIAEQAKRKARTLSRGFLQQLGQANGWDAQTTEMAIRYFDETGDPYLARNLMQSQIKGGVGNVGKTVENLGFNANLSRANKHWQFATQQRNAQIANQIKSLDNQLMGATPTEKPFISQQLASLREEQKDLYTMYPFFALPAEAGGLEQDPFQRFLQVSNGKNIYSLAMKGYFGDIPKPVDNQDYMDMADQIASYAIGNLGYRSNITPESREAMINALKDAGAFSEDAATVREATANNAQVRLDMKQQLKRQLTIEESHPASGKSYLENEVGTQEKENMWSDIYNLRSDPKTDITGGMNLLAETGQIAVDVVGSGFGLGLLAPNQQGDRGRRHAVMHLVNEITKPLSVEGADRGVMTDPKNLSKEDLEKAQLEALIKMIDIISGNGLNMSRSKASEKADAIIKELKYPLFNESLIGFAR